MEANATIYWRHIYVKCTLVVESPGARSGLTFLMNRVSRPCWLAVLCLSQAPVTPQRSWLKSQKAASRSLFFSAFRRASLGGNLQQSQWNSLLWDSTKSAVHRQLMEVIRAPSRLSNTVYKVCTYQIACLLVLPGKLQGQTEEIIHVCVFTR